MNNLKQIGKLIPYYQDYTVWYAKSKVDDYKCILDEYSDATRIRRISNEI